MTYNDLFIELLHRLESYDDAMALSVLLALGADEVPVVCTVGQLRQNHMAGALTPNRLALSMDRLENRGLLKLHRRSGRSRLVEFFAQRDAVSALLQNPFAYTRYTPGNQSLTVPFLKRSSESFAGLNLGETQVTEPAAHVNDGARFDVR
ncbi:MAG: hypothetical protein ACOVOX_07050 [Burkholderiaceae bacterium]